MPRKQSGRALVLVDFINPLDFPTGRGFLERAVRAAWRTRQVKRRLKSAGVPVIYANDHFGGWTRDFSELVRLCSGRTRGRELARLLAPEPDDYPILKPRHSAFYGTPLGFLLEELGVRALILTGIAADNCVLFTAHDAYPRRYRLWIPRDCVASVRDEDRERALLQMRRLLKAEVRSGRAAAADTRWAG